MSLRTISLSDALFTAVSDRVLSYIIHVADSSTIASSAYPTSIFILVLNMRCRYFYIIVKIHIDLMVHPDFEHILTFPNGNPS